MRSPSKGIDVATVEMSRQDGVLADVTILVGAEERMPSNDEDYAPANR